MRAASSSLQAALLAGVPMFVADLYQFTLATGDVFRWAAADRNILDGTNLYISAFDLTQSPPAPAISRGTWNLTATLEVDSLDLDIIAVPTMQVLGKPILAAITLGYFDNARVLIKRWYGLTPTDTSLGTITLFGPGRIGSPTVLRTSAKIPVHSELIVLNNPVPRTVVQTSCPFTLGDAGCGVNLASFTTAGSILSGSTRFQLNTTLSPSAAPGPPTSAPTLSDVHINDARSLATTYFAVITYVSAFGETIASPEAARAVDQDRSLVVHHPSSVPSGVIGYNVYVSQGPGSEMLQNAIPVATSADWTESGEGLLQGITPPAISTSGYYAQGTITFTSGALNGQSAHIKGNTGGILSLGVPLPVAPAAGDTFTAIAGDDKTLTTCETKFNNLARYGGTPYIPVPETLA